MVNGGYYDNQGQPRRFKPNNATYQPKHPNLSWRSNNVLQPNAPSNPPRQPYVPPFKQQPQWQPNQPQGWRRNNEDDPYGTILKALGDLKEGQNRLDTKFEDLSSRVKRLEAKEEQAQARENSQST